MRDKNDLSHTQIAWQEYVWLLETVLDRAFFCSVVTEFDINKPNDWRLVVMARKQKQQSDESIGKWNGIANIAIEDEHKVEAQALIEETPDVVVSRVNDMLAANYKFVLRWDDRSDCPMVSASCYDADSPNFKYTLVTRAPRWDFALALTTIKHFDIAGEDWSGSVEGDTWS